MFETESSPKYKGDGILSRLRPNKPKRAPSGWEMALMIKSLVQSELEPFGVGRSQIGWDMT